MASVYLAVQESLERQVALKVLAPALASQPGFKARFFNEGRIIAYLQHPQIVSIYDLGSHHHDYFLTMEFLSAGTLEQKIKQGIGPGRAVQLIKQIATALGFAHQQGVIHRDIKPQNILFRDDDLPVLTDFGIARLVDGGPQLTIPGRTLGSPFYMSPEQINGGKIDARADLYALGILFFTMLTNKLPYASDQIVAIALMHKSAPLPILPDDLSVFQPVINRLLAKDPDHRFGNAQELIDALVRIDSECYFAARKTDRRDDIQHPPVGRPASERLGLLGLARIHRSDDPSLLVLGTTLAAGQTKPKQPGRERGGVRPGQPLQKPDPAARISSDGRLVWEKGAVLGGASLALGFVLVLAVGLFGPAPLTPRQGDRAVPLETAVNDRMVVDQNIAVLLAKAQVQLAANRLTSPHGDNSFETYQQILALDPSNQAAESIATRITKAYHQLALGAKAKGLLQQGLIYIGHGLKVRPRDMQLLDLQAKLRQSLAEQEGIELEHARLLEQQQRERAAQKAAMEEKRKVEQELALRSRQEAERRGREAERIQLERQRAQQEIREQQKVKIEIEHPEPTGKASDHQNFLFGTF
jgi:hypothetical protein